MVSAYSNYLSQTQILCFGHFLHRFLLTIYDYDKLLEIIEKCRILSKKFKYGKNVYLLKD